MEACDSAVSGSKFDSPEKEGFKDISRLAEWCLAGRRVPAWY